MAFEEFFDYDNIFAEDNDYLLKGLQEDDKEDYMNLLISVSEITKAYKNSDFYEFTWEKTLNDAENLYLCIYLKETGAFIGKVMIKEPRGDRPEIGVDIVEEYRRRRTAFSAVSLAIARLKELTGTRLVEFKAYEDNVPSINLIKKLGAVQTGDEDGEFAVFMRNITKVINDYELEESKIVNVDSFSDKELERRILVFELEI